MSLHRTKAAIIGLLDAKRVNEWVVTEKLGNTLKQKNSKPPRKRCGLCGLESRHLAAKSRIRERLHLLELLMGVFLLYCAMYDFLFGRDHFYLYLFFQAGAFFIMGFGYVGTFVPN